jgi:hypothetical protein
MYNKKISINNLKKRKVMTKESRKYWLNRGCINWIINWKAGLDCFGYDKTVTIS